MANLAVQFFTDAKAQYEFAAKWRWIVLALVAYLHVGLVLPFAAAMRDKASVDAQLADGRAAGEALKPILAAAGDLAKQLGDAKDGAAKDLKDDLVARFRQLSEKVNALAALGPADAEGDKGADVFGAPAPPMPMMQQQAPRPDAATTAPMSPALRRQVAEAAKRPGDVPTALQAYVDAQVIAPAFARANAAWAANGAQIAQASAATIAASIAKTRSTTPAAAAELDRLDAATRALRDEAQRLTFAPPANTTWWRTVADKESTILSMTSGVAARVDALTKSDVALQALSARIDAIVEQNRRAASELTDTLADLDKRAAELQSQIGEIGSPLKLISFKLAQIAPLLPLVIAAALAAIATWTAEGLRRMTLSAQLVGEAADAKAVRVWLRAAAGGTHGRVVVVEIALAVASLAWVIAAARNVASLPPPFLTQTTLAAIAAIVVVAARAYHWRRADAAVAATA